jgi:hypothetical protein
MPAIASMARSYSCTHEKGALGRLFRFRQNQMRKLSTS